MNVVGGMGDHFFAGAFGSRTGGWLQRNGLFHQFPTRCIMKTPTSLLGAALCVVAPSVCFGQFEKRAVGNPEANAVYGLSSYADRNSSVTISVDSGVLRADLSLASVGSTGYSANAGVIVPLTFKWDTIDLSSARSLSFEYRISSKVTDYISVAIGSAAYSKAVSDAGTTYEWAIKDAAALKSGSDWKVASLDAADLKLPDWFKPGADFPTLADVLAQGRLIQIAPKSGYKDTGTEANGNKCSACANPSMPKLTIEFRKFVVGGLVDGDLALGLPDPRTAVGPRGPHREIRALVPSREGWRLSDPESWTSVRIAKLDGSSSWRLDPRRTEAIDLPAGGYVAILTDRQGVVCTQMIRSVR